MACFFIYTLVLLNQLSYRGGTIVIFDLDGTLYRTHETGLPAFRELCRKYEISLTAEGENFMLYTTIDSFLQKFAPDMTLAQRAVFGAEHKPLELAMVKEHGRLFDGVYELLAALASDGIEMTICGMGSKEYIDAVLERCGIAKFFKAVYHRVEGLTKTQVMKTLLADMMLEPAQCVMVGDSITDITAARENKVPFIGVTYGYGAEDIMDAGMLADDISQLHAEIYRTAIFSRIERDISRLPRPVLIGINGVDTSGKTSFPHKKSDLIIDSTDNKITNAFGD